MGKLSDILGGGNDDFRSNWNSTRAAEDFEALPSGSYTAHLVSGELEQSRKATPGYRLKFKVIEGEYAGRFVWHDLWLTPAALPMTKRDLAKIGISEVEQLEQPIPLLMRCKLTVALRKSDDGTIHNRVRRFEVIGLDEPEDDPFAPSEDASDDTQMGDSADDEF